MPTDKNNKAVQGKVEKKAVIFDLDGTLWDSTAQICRIWNDVFDGYSRLDLRVTQAEVKSCMGKTMEQIGMVLLPKEDPVFRSALMDECAAAEARLLGDWGGMLYEGLEETLDLLIREGGYELGIVSNSQDGYVDAFLQFSRLEKYFCDFEMSGRSGLSKSRNIRLVMERNGIGEAVYVGDTQGDRDAARSAGIPFIYASYGFGSLTDSSDGPAVRDYREIADIRELPALLAEGGKE